MSSQGWWWHQDDTVHTSRLLRTRRCAVHCCDKVNVSTKMPTIQCAHFLVQEEQGIVKIGNVKTPINRRQHSCGGRRANPYYTVAPPDTKRIGNASILGNSLTRDNRKHKSLYLAACGGVSATILNKRAEGKRLEDRPRQQHMELDGKQFCHREPAL